MTGLPDFLTDQPERAMSLDLVSDVLRAVRLDGAYFYKVTACAPWCVESSTEDAGAAAVLPGSEHLIPYHVLVEGRCWAGAPGSPLREMRAGDVVVFPRGGPQRLASGPGVKPSVGPVRFPVPERLPFKLDLGGKGPARATFVCGFLGCDRRPFNPVLDALPQVLFAGGAGGGLLGAFREQALQEVDAGRAGGELVVTRLAELMFIEVIRSYVQGLPTDHPGWFAGLRDEVVGRAMSLLHARPAAAWTLESLAREASCSRSVLGERFAELVGEPPMRYLVRWRMQLAARRLAESGAKLSEIARSVGYDSEEAFSRAFKRVVGASPGRWRATRGRPRLEGG